VHVDRAGALPDYVEMDAASNRTVEEMAQLLEQVVYAPVSGRRKVYMIDEVHMLTGHAFNAMLKTLEEPPPHVVFILATTDPKKVPVTVLSRCLQFNLKNLPPPVIARHLATVLDAEAVPFEPAALAQIGRAAAGSMRDALSLVDQAIAYGGGRVDEADVRDMLGVVDRRDLERMLDALAAGDGRALVAVADDMLSGNAPFERTLLDFAALLQRIALAQVGVMPDDDGEDAPGRWAPRLAAEDLQVWYQIAIHGAHDLPLAPDPHAGFSMTLLRLLAFRPDTGARCRRSLARVRTTSPRGRARRRRRAPDARRTRRAAHARRRPRRRARRRSRRWARRTAATRAARRSRARPCRRQARRPATQRCADPVAQRASARSDPRPTRPTPADDADALERGGLSDRGEPSGRSGSAGVASDAAAPRVGPPVASPPIPAGHAAPGSVAPRSDASTLGFDGDWTRASPPRSARLERAGLVGSSCTERAALARCRRLRAAGAGAAARRGRRWWQGARRAGDAVRPPGALERRGRPRRGHDGRGAALARAGTGARQAQAQIEGDAFVQSLTQLVRRYDPARVDPADRAERRIAMMKNQLAGLMKQAQQMQDNLKKAQEQLASVEVEGQSGAGLVKVTVTCRNDVKRVVVDPA
jgi:DNA polymerase-3 subunit gamma/tau